MSEQLCLFADDKEQRLEREIVRLRDQCEKLRKGQYAKLTMLEKMCKHLNEQVEFLNSNICKTNDLRLTVHK